MQEEDLVLVSALIYARNARDMLGGAIKYLLAIEHHSEVEELRESFKHVESVIASLEGEAHVSINS